MARGADHNQMARILKQAKVTFLIIIIMSLFLKFVGMEELGGGGMEEEK